MTSNSLALGMHRVPLAHKTLDAYAPVVGEDIVSELKTLARPLQGARVAHISATARGGGVAELLLALVPLMRSAGLDAEWQVITGTDAFFTVTKSMHNALQGMPLALTPEMRAIYLEVNRANAASFADDFDFVVVHDPQPAPLREMRASARGTWIWRSHIDLTHVNAAYWAFLQPYLQTYDAAIFTMPAFVSPDLQVKTVAIIPPAIDPLSQKNVTLPDDEVRRLVAARGVDPLRPLLVQVSRFDPWKDPLGVIDVYRAVRQHIPGVQLVLLGALAHDDPEGAHYYELTLAHAGSDPDIHILMNTHGEREVNAFQRHASVIVQKSLREGFGLTVTEGLWKARPVVGSNVGGISLQITDGVTGYLVETVAQTVSRVLDVLRDPSAAAAMGQRGHEVVRHQFLSTANLGNYLRLFNQLKP
ncbi:MAG TPA: glycosyltransferase [Ktedonobacterales bacterium]